MLIFFILSIIAFYLVCIKNLIRECGCFIELQKYSELACGMVLLMLL